MIVKRWMSKPAITIDAEDSVREALKLMKQHNIKMLPALEEDKLVGVVSKGDLNQASTYDVFSRKNHELTDLIDRIKIKMVMTKHPITAPPDATIDETAQKLLLHNISRVPVQNASQELVGVITKNDILQVLLSLTGINKKGIQLGLKINDRPGAIKEVTDIIRDYGGRVANILSTGDRIQDRYINIYMRVYGVNKPTLERIKEVIAETGSILYIVDHEGKTREIYEEDLP